MKTKASECLHEQRSCPTCRYSAEAYKDGIESHCGSCVSQSTDGTQMAGWSQSMSVTIDELWRDDNGNSM